MSEDRHQEDEFFRKAYGNFREHPSPRLREKILAHMSDHNAGYQPQKRMSGKRMAFVLLLLLGGLFFPRLLNDDTSHPASETAYEKSHQPGTSDPLYKGGVFKKNNISQIEQTHQPIQTFVSHHKNQEHILYEGKAYSIHHYYYHLPAQGSADGGKPDTKTAQNTSLSLQKMNGNPGFYPDTEVLSYDRNHWSLSVPSTERFGWDSRIGKENNADAAIAITTLTTVDTASLIADVQRWAESKNSLSPGSIVSPVARRAVARHRWELTPLVSLDFTQYHLDNDDTFNGNLQEDKQDIANKERHEFSFSAGLLARWQSDKKIAFKTGVLYSNVMIGIQPQTLYATTDANQTTSYKLVTSSGYAYVKPVFGSSPVAGDSITSDHSLHHLHYVSVPVLLSYALLNAKRISLAASTGVNTSFLLGSKIETDVNDRTNKEALVINKLIGLRPLYFSFMADLELQYHINSHIGITFNPMMKYAFTSATKNYVVKTFPYSVSAGAGISYKF